MSTRSNLYAAARILGWIQAGRRGRLPQRTANVVLGRLIGRAIQRLWR